MLMDRELPEEERARIRAVISAHKGVLEIHDLRTRSSGPQTFIQCHIELDGGQSLLQAHAIADAVERALRRAFPGAEVIIHPDPYPASRRLAAGPAAQACPAPPRGQHR